MPELKFPKNFLWGTATSSYQIEGGHDCDGKGVSIWDRFSHEPGNIAHNDNGDIACDHYHRYREDVKLLKELGIQSYRFSISWPRIFPDGMGEPNERGMDFYRDLVRLLNENGIKPAVTLYHWDLPQKLQDIGGWANPDIVEYFERYARYVFNALGDAVPIWITFNEPWVSSFVGYWYGGHPPGITDLPTALRAAHHTLLAHGKAVQAYREMGLMGEIGITLNLNPVYPASESDEDMEAAIRHGDFLNGWFLEPIFKGRYPEKLRHWLAEKIEFPQFNAEDMKAISASVDFLGVNTYSFSSVRHDPEDWPLQMGFANTGKDRTDTGWEIYPEGLYDLLVYLHEEYGGIKMYITENGAAYMDEVDENGQVEDDKRIEYLQAHIDQVHRAVVDGVNLAGYFLWSFLDNFEWRMGYSKRFGLVYIDYGTLERIVKKSGWWYRDVIERNGI